MTTTPAHLGEHLVALNKIINGIKVKDIMSTPVITVAPDEDFSVVQEIFVSRGIRHLTVVDGNNKLLGVISQKDVYTHIAPRRLPEGQIAYREGIIIDGDGYYEKESLNQYILNYIMHREPPTITENETLGDAIKLLITMKVGCLPVVDANKRVLGIITRGDFLRLANSIYKKI